MARKTITGLSQWNGLGISTRKSTANEFAKVLELVNSKQQSGT